MGPKVLSIGRGVAFTVSLTDPTVLTSAIVMIGAVAVVVVLAVAITRPSIELSFGKGSFRLDFSRKGRRKPQVDSR